MNLKRLWIFSLATMLCISSAEIMAQAPSAGAGQNSAGDPSNPSATGFGNSMSSEQVRQLANYVDTANVINRKDLKNAPPKEEVVKRVKEIIDVLKLDCSVKDAALAGNSTEDGYQTNLYEVACTNGMGYFLNSRSRFKHNKLGSVSAKDATAITCFSAEAMHQNELAKGKKSEFYCQLPDNGSGDIAVIGGRLLAAAGANCNISKLAWFGVDDNNKIEYDEAACDDGTGYILQTPLAGGTIKPTAMSCVDAAQKGLDCKMTPVIKPPTLETFKDYLAHTDVNCKIDSYDQIKVLGKESLKQRYVVEFKCPEQPNGLVAFIPLDGNPNKFETVDCDGVKKHGVSCKLTTKN